MSRRRHVVVFARVPRPGRVKTRLGAEVGVDAAWRFYRRCLYGLLRRLAHDRRWRTWIGITPDAARLPPGRIGDARHLPQGRGDLGRRMARAFRALPAGPAVIVGSDIPGIRRRHVAAAFRALAAADAVIGPAGDGGYWLVGFRRAETARLAFEGVRWSTPNALADTLANLERGGFSAALLERLDDVDDAASFARWREGVSRGAP